MEYGTVIVSCHGYVVCTDIAALLHPWLHFLACSQLSMCFPSTYPSPYIYIYFSTARCLDGNTNFPGQEHELVPFRCSLS